MLLKKIVFTTTLLFSPAIMTTLPAQEANAQEQVIKIPELSEKDITTINEYQDKVIRFHGKVKSFRASWSETAPNLIKFTSGDKQVEVAFWTRGTNFDVEPFSKHGAEVFLQGTVQNYRGMWQIKVDDLRLLSTKCFWAKKPEASEAKAPAAAAAKPQKLEWAKFDSDAVKAELSEFGHVTVYIRTPENPLSATFENDYLLHERTPELMGPRVIYYLTHKEAWVLPELGLPTSVEDPALMVLKKGETASVFVFKESTTGAQVATFMKQIPR